MAEQETGPGGIIIHLFGEPPAVDGAPQKAERGRFCYPHSPLIDKVSRLVTCKRCKQTLDPVDVLLQVASEYDQWVRLLEETRQLRKEIASLKDEEKRVKARTKSHSRKVAAEAVFAEQEKHFAQLCEVLTRTGEITRAAKRIEQLTGLHRRAHPTQQKEE